MQHNCESHTSFSKTNTKQTANINRKGPCGKLMLTSTATHETLWPHQSQALDGINDSLKKANPIEEMEEDTKVNLGFDKELLYKNMVAAGADWLYGLEEWNDIFDEDKRKALYKEQKESTTIHKAPKVYPNDPCPCGSGKKYKKCCGKNA